MSTPPPDGHRTAVEYLLALAALGHEVSMALAATTEEREFVNNAPLLVMCTLDLNGPTRPGALQDVVGLSSGGTTKLLDRMEEHGWIRRSYGTVEGDNRGVLVTPTRRGTTALRRVTGELGKVLPQTKVMTKTLLDLTDQIERAV